MNLGSYALFASYQLSVLSEFATYLKTPQPRSFSEFESAESAGDSCPALIWLPQNAGFNFSRKVMIARPSPSELRLRKYLSCVHC